VKVVLKTGDIVLFNRLDDVSAGKIVQMYVGVGEDISYRINPLDSVRAAVFVVNVVVRCIMSFVGPVPLEDLDALSDG
jgi:hypothetical protein